MPLAWTPAVRFLTVLAALLALVATTASAQPTEPAPATGEALFVVSGRGWGHGVGMSQYGAYGMAQAGKTHEEILAHYYTGTELGRAGKKELRVLLAEGRKAVTISSTVPFTIVDGSGETFKLPKGAVTFRSDLSFTTADGGLVQGRSPLLLRPGKAAPLGLDGNAYRGAFELAAQTGFLRVINVTSLDAYVQGVIASEMPFTWPAAALEAQAIASRTYALAGVIKGKPYDLYSDVRSQVYRGVAGEQPKTNAAARTTSGKVVLYGGKIATTFYFSTSGGKTASAFDVFGQEIPYLVSRPDPWDKASPYHRWGPVLIGARTLQSKLGIETRVLDATGVATPSGRLRTLTLQTATGPSKVPVGLLRTGLGLRSTWVTIGVLRLDQPKGTAVAGTPVRLTGIARGLPAPVLASSVDGGAWTQVGALERDPGGSFSIDIKPTRTTRYRIQVKSAASAAVIVQVAPKG
jgi:stage II sporulation protein D